jgi:hypothetical protein
MRDWIQQLVELAGLRDFGALSEAEYLVWKAKVMAASESSRPLPPLQAGMASKAPDVHRSIRIFVDTLLVDIAIETLGTLRLVSPLPLSQAEGFVHSLLSMIGLDSTSK